MSTLPCQNCHSTSRAPGSPYCTKTCAGLNGPQAQHARAQQATQIATSQLCQLDGCKKPVYPGSQACSKSHLTLLRSSTAVATTHHVATKCLLPSCTNPPAPGHHVCSQLHLHQLKLSDLQKKCAASFTSQPPITPQEVRNHASRSPKIDFYNIATNPTTSFLGNFHITSQPIMFRSLSFKCAEGAYQYSKLLVSQKFLQSSPEIQKAIIQLFQEADGEEAWHLANNNINIIQLIDTAAHKANNFNLHVMEEILRDKFQQGSEEWKLLQATGDKPLRECTGGKDNYWGLDSAGKGQNKLGQLLMQIRDETKSSSTTTQTATAQTAPPLSWGEWAKSWFQ